MLNRIFVFGLALFMFIPINHAFTFNVSDEVSVGSPFYVQAQVDWATERVTCSLSSYDQFGNVKQVWNFDDKWDRLRTDSSGYLYSEVHFDDRYFVQSNYTLTINCANETGSQVVTVDTPGNMQINIAGTNLMSYFVRYPVEVAGGVALAIVGAMSGFALWRRIKRV